jgi:hypothetical protein
MFFLTERLKALPLAAGAFVVYLLLPQSFRKEWGAAVVVAFFWFVFTPWDNPKKYFRKSKQALINWTRLILSVAACFLIAQSVNGNVIRYRRNTYIPAGLLLGTAAFWAMQLILLIADRAVMNRFFLHKSDRQRLRSDN